jgi:TRAP-type C4-dicarboxylate transport system permease small subunit
VWRDAPLKGKKPIRVDHWIAAMLLMAMALIAFVNVLSRYFVNFSIGATEEITINLFVWMTVVGTGIAFERGAQLGMVTFFNLFSFENAQNPGGF